MQNNMTIREMILIESEKLRDVSVLGPSKASEELTKLSSLLSSLNSYIAEKHYALNIVRQSLLEKHGTAAKAKIYSEATQEWKEWNEAVQQGKALEEMIRSVKYYLRNAEAEMKMGM